MSAIWSYLSTKVNYALPKNRVMTIIMSELGIFHIGLLLLFLWLEIYPMAILTVFSILLYAYCFIQTRKNKHLLLVFNLSYAEIMVYAVISVFLLGVNGGFSLYTISMLPLGYYAAYNFDSEKRVVNPMFYVIISVVSFSFVQLLGSSVDPLYSYGNEQVEKVVYMVNYLVAVIAILIFFSTLINEIKYLENQSRHQNQRLEELSKTDALTGLANRRSIQERYTDLETLKEGYAVILGDIDDFKKVNDTYGHNVGDEVLKDVANVFKRAVRGEDIVCRWGGEEILIFLPHCPLNNAKYRAQDILAKIRTLDLKAQDDTIFHITMTLGVAISEEADTFTGVVKKADERLYEGKRNGKDQVV